MKNLKIGTKIWLLVAILLFFVVIAIIGGRNAISQVKQEAVLQIEQVMNSSHKTELKALVDSTALNMAAEIEGLTEAKDVIERLRKLNNPIRFFDNKSGYFFIYDLQGVCQSLPPKQSLQGKSLIDLKDQNGLYLVKELRQAAQNGGGFVTYVWPKPPSDEQQPKLSYARMIPGTEFWIGTGIYIDDIEAQKKTLTASMSTRIRPILLWSVTILSLFFILLVLPMILLLIRQTVRPLKQLKAVASELEQGNLNSRAEWNSTDEIGELASSLNAMAKNLSHYAEQAHEIANGNLMVQVQVNSPKDTLGAALKAMVESLQSIIGNIRSSADQIASGSVQVSDSSQLLSQGATESAASLEEIAASMNEIGTQSKQSAENALQANQLTAGAREAADSGASSMNAMITAMGEINDAGQNIHKIIKVIDEIAFQTNLLALNAAVEAARAGQHGKGFAVVAEEVRNLAARSAKAAQETAELIEGSVQKAANGTQIAKNTADALEGVISEITKVTALVGEIATASHEQANGIEQVNTGLTQIDQVIQQNTASAEESASTSEELSSQAAELKHQLSHFELGDESRNYNLRTPSFPRPRIPAQTTSTWGGVPAQITQQTDKGFVIPWDARFNTGISAMDKQHQRLVELINQLFQCMKDGGDRMILGGVVDELVKYTVYHFRAEEDLMRQHRYPDFETHKQIHEQFIAKVAKFADNLKSGERLAPADIYKFLKDWLISHIEKQDRDGYALFVKK